MQGLPLLFLGRRRKVESDRGRRTEEEGGEEPGGGSAIAAEAWRRKEREGRARRGLTLMAQPMKRENSLEQGKNNIL